MLGFAYASIFIAFMGNVTQKHGKFYEHDPHWSEMYTERIAEVADTEDKYSEAALTVTNRFGRLHFVSCGSRGLEPFPFIKFISVYK